MLLQICPFYVTKFSEKVSIELSQITFDKICLLIPDLLLLDEPTTGLDSYTSHYLIRTLANLAHTENKIILLSIHQPRSDIFNVLDTVGILCGGEMVYYGPREELVPYFTKIGHPCPTFSNPLDFYSEYRFDMVSICIIRMLNVLENDMGLSIMYYNVIYIQKHKLIYICGIIIIDNKD